MVNIVKITPGDMVLVSVGSDIDFDEYQNIYNNTITKEFEGFSSTIISYEIDHLDGIFHIDRNYTIK